MSCVGLGVELLAIGKPFARMQARSLPCGAGEAPRRDCRAWGPVSGKRELEPNSLLRQEIENVRLKVLEVQRDATAEPHLWT
jgi:hypothetical protein